MKQSIYSYKAVENLVEQYEKTGKEFYHFVIAGCLCDNHIICGDGLKTAIIREVGLNEWSSGQTIRMYNKTPEKYSKIIDLLLDGEEEQAEKLFFA